MKKEDFTHVDTQAKSSGEATGGMNELARAFRAGWAAGFQECAEGAVIDWATEHGERPALETAALERWLFVEAASKARELADPHVPAARGKIRQ
jgi:hypothetical protein